MRRVTGFWSSLLLCPGFVLLSLVLFAQCRERGSETLLTAFTVLGSLRFYFFFRSVGCFSFLERARAIERRAAHSLEQKRGAHLAPLFFLSSVLSVFFRLRVELVHCYVCATAHIVAFHIYCLVFGKDGCSKDMALFFSPMPARSSPELCIYDLEDAYIVYKCAFKTYFVNVRGDFHMQLDNKVGKSFLRR